MVSEPPGLRASSGFGAFKPTNTAAESLREYFSQFGEVVECTVMRDNSTGRSRGFGFLTFKDAKTVNVVMVKEHYLDGKIVGVLARLRFGAGHGMLMLLLDRPQARNSPR